jgi:hypothetical protein
MTDRKITEPAGRAGGNPPTRLQRRRLLSGTATTVAVAGCARGESTGSGSTGTSQPNRRENATAATPTDPLPRGYLPVPSERHDTVQAAHDALPDGGGVILLQDTVRETDVTLSKPVRVVGQGSVARSYHSEGGQPAAVLDTSGGAGITVVGRGVVLEHLQIVGDGTGDYGLKLDGSAPGHGGKSVFDNVVVHGKGGHGVVFEGGQLNSRIDVTAHRCGGDGFRFKGPWFNENTFHRLAAWHCAGNGVYVEASKFNGNVVNQFWVEESGEWGFYVEDGCRFEGNHVTGYGIENNGGRDTTGSNQVMRLKNLEHPQWAPGTNENFFQVRNLVSGETDVDEDEFCLWAVDNRRTVD